MKKKEFTQEQLINHFEKELIKCIKEIFRRIKVTSEYLKDDYQKERQNKEKWDQDYYNSLKK